MKKASLKHYWTIILILAFGTSCPVKADNIVSSAFKHEAVAVSLEPGWRLVQKNMGGEKCTLKFVPPGEVGSEDHKFISLVTSVGLQQKTNASAMMQDCHTQAESNKGTGSLDFKTISDSDPQDVMFEFTVKNNSGHPDYWEVHRIITGQDGMHSLTFHTTDNLSEADRNKVIDLIKQTSLKKI